MLAGFGRALAQARWCGRLGNGGSLLILDGVCDPCAFVERKPTERARARGDSPAAEFDDRADGAAYAARVSRGEANEVANRALAERKLREREAAGGAFTDDVVAVESAAAARVSEDIPPLVVGFDPVSVRGPCDLVRDGVAGCGAAPDLCRHHAPRDETDGHPSSRCRTHRGSRLRNGVPTSDSLSTRISEPGASARFESSHRFQHTRHGYKSNKEDAGHRAPTESTRSVGGQFAPAGCG
jgi:hypothetical protein